MKIIKKRGISLIVLIVTIIVVIILAAVVVLTLSKNNPINSSKEATFKEDIYNFKTELELYKAKISGNGEDVTKLYASKDSDPSITDVIPSMSKKYIDKLEVREGKLTYIGKDREEYLQSRDMNLLPEDELLDDDILTELKPFITEWTVEAGDSITLPISGTCNFTVDYGDGSGKYSVTSATDEDRIHIYENAGTYVVTIEGRIGVIYFRDYGYSTREKLTRIKQWGVINASKISFWECSKLTGPIPEPSKNSFKNLSDVNHMFYGCTALNCEIPEKLFYSCPNIMYFDMTFSCCGFTGTIPEKLFSKCPNVKSFGSTFRGSGKFTGPIPENLFANNTKVTNFSNCFMNCFNFTGNISNLFKNNPNVTNFSYCFFYCNKLIGDAPKLWERDNVSTYDHCFSYSTNFSNYSEIPNDWKTK